MRVCRAAKAVCSTVDESRALRGGGGGGVAGVVRVSVLSVEGKMGRFINWWILRFAPIFKVPQSIVDKYVVFKMNTTPRINKGATVVLPPTTINAHVLIMVL